MHARMHARTRARTHACTHTRTYARTHARTHTDTNTRTHTHAACELRLMVGGEGTAQQQGGIVVHACEWQAPCLLLP